MGVAPRGAFFLTPPAARGLLHRLPGCTASLRPSHCNQRPQFSPPKWRRASLPVHGCLCLTRLPVRRGTQRAPRAAQGARPRGGLHHVLDHVGAAAPPAGGDVTRAARGRGLRLVASARALAGVEAAAPALGERPRPGRARGHHRARRSVSCRLSRPRRLVRLDVGCGGRAGRCHSPSPRRPGSCVAGAGVSSARPAAASDPARPPSPQRLRRAFPARGPARGAPRAAGCARALCGT